MSRFESNKSKFVDVKVLPPATILENCRTVVEKRDFVSTGIMSIAAGDMLEVEISDYDRFILGEQVKLNVYTPAGIYMIASTIVGKDTGSLIMINPPDNQKKFEDKRKHPRVEVTQTGLVASVIRPDGKGTLGELARPLEFQVRNISLSGIGFTLEEEIKLDPSCHVEMEIHLGTVIPCVAEIVRSEADEAGIYYGARYVRMPDEKLNSLRAFILREQIAAHSMMKRSDQKKRMFK